MDNLPVEVLDESYIFFSIGTYNYAFNSEYVLDIIQLVELEYPESMPDFMAGLLEYNNKITKVIDLKYILNIDSTNYNLNSKIIIVKTKNDTFGILIDDVTFIKRINSSLINTPPYENDKSFVKAIFTNKEFSSTVLNLENIENKINSKDFKINENKTAAPVSLPDDIQSKEILHRRKLHYARKKREGSEIIIKSQDTYITFKLNNNTCCIKILHVAGFYQFINVKITKVPCTPDFIEGVVNLKGRYITVIDLLKFTENKKTPITKDTNIIIVEYEDYEIGILADAIGETIDIDENILKNKTENSKTCLTEFVFEGIMYLYFDIKKMFEDEKLYVS